MMVTSSLNNTQFPSNNLLLTALPNEEFQKFRTREVRDSG